MFVFERGQQVTTISSVGILLSRYLEVQTSSTISVTSLWYYLWQLYYVNVTVMNTQMKNSSCGAFGWDLCPLNVWGAATSLIVSVYTTAKLHAIIMQFWTLKLHIFAMRLQNIAKYCIRFYQI